MVVRVTWVVRLVLVIEFVNANGSHGLNNQIIEKTCDFTPVTETHTHTHGKVGQHPQYCLSIFWPLGAQLFQCRPARRETARARMCRRTENDYK